MYCGDSGNLGSNGAVDKDGVVVVVIIFDKCIMLLLLLLSVTCLFRFIFLS